jgi:hypothetical protein
LEKPLPFDKTFIFSWISLNIVLSKKSFNKTYWLPYWPSYIIDLTWFLFVYISTFLPTHLLTYLPITYTMLMFANVWYTKYEGIALNELTTILITFDLLMLINNNPECGYYTFNHLLCPTCRYCIFWYLLLETKIVEDLITK